MKNDWVDAPTGFMKYAPYVVVAVVVAALAWAIILGMIVLTRSVL